MEVIEVIISALNLLGRRELAEKLSAGNTLEGEETEMADTLLYCFNAVEDELARKYVPLTAKEELTSYTGRFNYSDFSRPPVKIKDVFADGKAVEYELTPQYIAANAVKITVEYQYAPSKKKLDGVSDFNCEVSGYLMALGIAAEYCLINGEIEASGLWEKKYREQIDFAQSKLPHGGSVPPRRWV